MFSVITPAYNRADTIERCIKSLDFQTDPDLEHIIVDDKSKDMTTTVIEEYDPKYIDVRLIKLEEHSERCIARNAGMEAAKGEWICWLDSDDAYTQRYIETIKRAIERYPEYKVFNFGSIVHHNDDGFSIRPTFRPKVMVNNKDGTGQHEDFVGGNIGTGSFFFHRSVLEDVGGLPEVKSPYHVRDRAGEEFAENWKANEPLFSRHIGGLSLGNPWGDDYYMFYKITRKYVSVPLNSNLYYHNVR